MPQGRVSDAERLFRQLIALRNDLGLLSEEYDPRAKRLVGNFPQAFSHMALVNSAYNLTRAEKPVEQRAQPGQQAAEELTGGGRADRGLRTAAEGTLLGRAFLQQGPSSCLLHCPLTQINAADLPTPDQGRATAQ